MSNADEAFPDVPTPFDELTELDFLFPIPPNVSQPVAQIRANANRLLCDAEVKNMNTKDLALRVLRLDSDFAVFGCRFSVFPQREQFRARYLALCRRFNSDGKRISPNSRLALDRVHRAYENLDPLIIE